MGQTPKLAISNQLPSCNLIFLRIQIKKGTAIGHIKKYLALSYISYISYIYNPIWHSAMISNSPLLLGFFSHVHNYIFYSLSLGVVSTKSPPTIVAELLQYLCDYAAFYEDDKSRQTN